VPTHWRLFRDGFALEVGDLFSLNTDENFHINAVSGDIRFWTFESTLVGSLQRARLKRAGSITIGSYVAQSITGHFGLGTFNSSVSNPYTLIHLDEAGSNVQGYRPSMHEGVSSSRGPEYGYAGLIAAATGSADRDYGIVWSRQLTAPGQPSRLRFIYTGTDGGTTPQAVSQAGLELGRFEPAVNLNEGYFGIGNWTFAGISPNERLDVLNGAVKVRDLPLPAYQSTTLTKVLVVDDVAPNVGKLKWRDASTLGNACSSGWSLTGTTAATAYNGNPCPPQDIDLVGIGTNTPSAKLEVVRMVNGLGATSTGFNLRMGTTSTNNVGGHSNVQTTATGLNTGWRANASNGGMNWGLDGNAAVNNLVNSGLWTNSRLAGVRGFADGNGSMLKPNVRGVWGVAIGALSPTGAATMGYAGWFDGDVNIQGGDLYLNQIFAISDASVKTNVQDLQNAGDLIAQLNPKTYFFDTLAHTELGLPTELQRGLIAPDVEQVLPELVTEVQHEARYDTLGNEVSAAYTLKAVNYIGFIPLLLANAKEQQATIAQQSARIDLLQQQIAQCCSTGATDSHAMQQGAGFGTTRAETDLRIIPNPVAASTQLRYTVADHGRVRLEVSDGMGRVIEVLEEATRESGTFTYEWNTQQLAAGTYFCTLFVNDEPLVKKAVKLNDR
jgi:hypothetical protein